MNDEPEKGGWGLVFAFPDQSPSFAYGFTCGRLWEQMRAPYALEVRAKVVSECRPTVEAMAMTLGWVEDFEDIGDGWLLAVLTKPQTPWRPGDSLAIQGYDEDVRGVRDTVLDAALDAIGNITLSAYDGPELKAKHEALGLAQEAIRKLKAHP